MTDDHAAPFAAESPRLIAIDMDHTILRSDRTISERTQAAVSACTAAGVAICLASSRYPDAMVDYLRLMNLDGFFVASQGATIGLFTSRSFALVSRHTIDRDTALVCATIARAEGFAVNWFVGDAWYVQAVTASVAREAEVVARTPRVVPDWNTLPAPEKLLLIAEGGADVSNISDILPNTLSATASNPRYLEVTAAGINKGTGVAEVARNLAVPSARVWAIGDGDNDLALFAYAGRSFAPANANARVLAAADVVTASNDEDGVALVLESAARLIR